MAVYKLYFLQIIRKYETKNGFITFLLIAQLEKKRLSGAHTRTKTPRKEFTNE